MKLVNIGFGNLLNARRVVAVVTPDSAPVKRLVQMAKDSGKLVDLTQGRKTQSVIFTDSEHCFLSYLKTETLGERFSEPETPDDNSEE